MTVVVAVHVRHVVTVMWSMHPFVIIVCRVVHFEFESRLKAVPYPLRGWPGLPSRYQASGAALDSPETISGTLTPELQI